MWTVVLLYFDILGMKARWKTRDVEVVKRAFFTLDDLIEEALSAAHERVQDTVMGGVQSDAAALLFEKAEDAVRVGRAIFQNAFLLGSSAERFWLRGVIIPVEGDDLESVVNLTGGARKVAKRVFCDELMTAINHEQSGYGGQRLLLSETLFNDELAKKFMTEVRSTGSYPRSIFHLAQLKHSEAVEGFRDVLWMVPENIASWHVQRERISRRLRWSAADREEFRHAALTALVFEEVEAIRLWIGAE